MKIFVLVLFVLMFALIIAIPKYKPIVTGVSALICTVACSIAGVMVWHEPFSKAINYNVVMLLVGIMITVGLFSESGMPNKLADKLISKVPNVMWVLVLISLLSGIISAFVDNVATVLMLAPIGFAIAKKAGVSPIPVLISIAVSSNLQGAATLVGDTTSVMLAGELGMSFVDFFFYNGKFSIFWAVELGMLATVPVLIILFRKQNKKFEFERSNVKVTTLFPTIMLLLNVALLVACSFVTLPSGFLADNINGLICLFFGVVCLLYHIITAKRKEVVLEDGTVAVVGGKKQALKTVFNTIDYQTVLFLVFLFVVIQAVENVGIIADISSFFGSIGESNIFLLYTLIVFGSVLISAFIDNIPYVATMLPVIMALSVPPQVQTLLCFGLLSGATLGGNITPVGASANVVAIGMLNREGYKVKSSDFFKIGIPFTLSAVLAGYAFIWFVWA
ncbi:MAG: TRAP transporter large permease subunit [Clostridiales bacterium]|nr:TRAP transporter large permease subunit [Clostridiales bacterium]